MIQINLSFHWWLVPLLLTVLVFVVWKIYDNVTDTGGFMGGIGGIFAMIPALAVVAVIWVVAAFLK